MGIRRFLFGFAFPFPGCLAHGERALVGVVALDWPGARHRSVRWFGVDGRLLWLLRVRALIRRYFCFPPLSRGAWFGVDGVLLRLVRVRILIRRFLFRLCLPVPGQADRWVGLGWGRC